MFSPETRILILDDMLTMRKLVKKSLQGLGFKNITEAADGELGWEEIEKAMNNAAPFQLVISDWNMPKVSGIDLLKKIRSIETTKKLPFILLTAEFDREQVLEAIKAGIDAYITKPFSVAILNEKLQNVWNQIEKTKNKTAA